MPTLRWRWAAISLLLWHALLCGGANHQKKGQPVFRKHLKSSNRDGARGGGVEMEWVVTASLFKGLDEPWATTEIDSNLLSLHVRHLRPKKLKIAVVMADSRPCHLDADGEAIAEGGELALSYVSPSLVLNYALKHGYDFLKARLPGSLARLSAWYSIPLFINVLPNYEYIMKMDTDAFFHELETPIENLIREQGLDKDKYIFAPGDVHWPGFEFPDSNVCAGVIVLRQGPQMRELLDDWWKAPFTINKTDWTWNWPGEQGALWFGIMNTTKWAPISQANWDVEYIQKRPNFVHHYTSGSYKPEARNKEGLLEATRVFMKQVKQRIMGSPGGGTTPSDKVKVTRLK